MFYYKNKSFYSEFAVDIPAGAIQLTDDQFQEIEAGLLSGKILAENADGFPVCVVPPVTKADLVAFVSAEADKIAYGGITIIANGHEYLFKTTTDNITRCNSVLAMYSALPDDTVIPWEVWQGDFPVMLPVNKVQFKQGFAFGGQMIIAVETVKGTLNAEAQKLTNEQLANPDYVMAFKENTVIQLAAVNTVFNLDSMN